MRKCASRERKWSDCQEALHVILHYGESTWLSCLQVHNIYFMITRHVDLPLISSFNNVMDSFSFYHVSEYKFKLHITKKKKMLGKTRLPIANFQKEIELSCGHAYLQKHGQLNKPLSRSILEAKLYVEVCWSRTGKSYDPDIHWHLTMRALDLPENLVWLSHWQASHLLWMGLQWTLPKHGFPVLISHVCPLLTHPSERKTSFQMDPGSFLHFNVTLLMLWVMC